MYFYNKKGTLNSKLIACFKSPHDSGGYVVVEFFLGLSLFFFVFENNSVR